MNLHHLLDLTVTSIGCESLLQISKADKYFKRVIIMLDGDARFHKDEHKPKVNEYLHKDFNPTDLGLSDRCHEKNVCFLPGYFAPESYLFRIINYLIDNQHDHFLFWRSLDEKEETSLYTADKIKGQFSSCDGEYNNKQVKKCFNKEMWRFIESSNILNYYYSNTEYLDELLLFFEKVKCAYSMTYALTISNRHR